MLVVLGPDEGDVGCRVAVPVPRGETRRVRTVQQTKHPPAVGPLARLSVAVVARAANDGCPELIHEHHQAPGREQAPDRLGWDGRPTPPLKIG